MRKLILVSMAMVGLPLAAWAFQADVIAPPHGDFPVSVGGQLSFGLLNGEAKEHVTLIVPGNSFCEFVLRLASEFQKENLAKEVRECAREGAEVRPLFGKE